MSRTCTRSSLPRVSSTYPRKSRPTSFLSSVRLNYDTLLFLQVFVDMLRLLLLIRFKNKYLCPFGSNGLKILAEWSYEFEFDLPLQESWTQLGRWWWVGWATSPGCRPRCSTRPAWPAVPCPQLSCRSSIHIHYCLVSNFANIGRNISY